MRFLNVKSIVLFLSSFYMYTHAERVYTVEKLIIPEYHIKLNDTAYTHISTENQVFDNEWKNSQKISFNYDYEGKQTGYSVVIWKDSLNSWADTMYCMFFYNSLNQPISYQVSQVYNDTVDYVIYKEYYLYNNTTNRLDKITIFSKNSADSLVISSEEIFLYSQNSELDSVITVNYDEDANYVWSVVSEKVNYISDTMYSISENTSYKPHPDSPSICFDIEHQYLFSADGKKKMQGRCLLPGLITERTLYSYREEDGLPEIDLNQNIKSIAEKSYSDTSRIIYEYSFQGQLLIKTSTTEILSPGGWVPVTKIINRFASEVVSTKKNYLNTNKRDLKIKIFLSQSSNPVLSISSPEKILSIEIFSINGVLLHKEKKCPDQAQFNLSGCKIKNYCGQMIARIQLESGFTSIQKVFSIR